MEGIKLKYPEKQTWFICWNNDRTEIKSYGSVMPKQCLGTNLTEIDYFLEKSEWSKILLDNNIDITNKLKNK